MKYWKRRKYRRFHSTLNRAPRSWDIPFAGVLKKVLLIIIFSLMAYSGYMLITGYIRSLDSVAVAREAFDMINEARTEEHMAPLTWDKNMEELAIKHAKYMNDTHDFNHSTYGYSENILKSAWPALPFTTAYYNGHQIFDRWLGSLPHSKNMFDPSLRFGAIGLAGRYAVYLAR